MVWSENEKIYTAERNGVSLAEISKLAVPCPRPQASSPLMSLEY